MDKAKVSLMLI